MIRQTVEEYIKERYGEMMGYEKICPICKEHYDAGEECDCQERRVQAVKLITECLKNEESCMMNLVTMDHVYFENVSIRNGEGNSIDISCAGRSIGIDLNAILEAQRV